MVSKDLMSIIKELEHMASMVKEEEIDGVVSEIMNAKRIFVSGAGRSGFAARAFSNRLMHLGFDVNFVGEPTTPSIREGDLLVIGSGSGMTESLVTNATKSISEGARLVTLTIHPENKIGSMAHAYIKIPGISSRNQSEITWESVQPNGSSFEQLSWLVYDTIVVSLKKKTNQTQKEMDYRHANME